MRIGYPSARSFDCVAKMANSPALLNRLKLFEKCNLASQDKWFTKEIYCNSRKRNYLSLVVKKVMIITEKKTEAFARSMAPRKVQFTEVIFNWHKVLNIRDGSANVPTNVLSPFASVSEMKLNLFKKNIMNIFSIRIN